MIFLFSKLKRENLLKEKGLLLDLGSGEGRASEVFFKHGYDAVLVDINKEALSKAEERFKSIGDGALETFETSVEQFEFKDNYDAIIMSNILPFLENKIEIERIVKKAFEKLNTGGFLFFTLFGEKDQWATEKRENMVFFSKEDSLEILNQEPYFFSEDYGLGATMKGDIKKWHMFHLLYVKEN